MTELAPEPAALTYVQVALNLPLRREFAYALPAGFTAAPGNRDLRYFRTFHQVYSARLPEIRHITCGESAGTRHIEGGVLPDMALAVAGGSHTMERRWRLKKPEMAKLHDLFQGQDRATYVEAMLASTLRR